MQKINIISTLLLTLISMSIQAQGNFKINPNGDKDLAAVNEYLEAVYSRDPNQIENIHASDLVGYGPRWNSPGTRQQIVDSYNYTTTNFLEEPPGCTRGKYHSMDSIPSRLCLTFDILQFRRN